MGLTAGIVGLPNVGKSTLFNAITKSKALAANYPFATIDPNVGVVEVPDERIEQLVKMYQPKKTIYTTFEFTDVAGLVRGASQGEGLGNQFLSHIRSVDAICQVVRCFEDDNVIHVEGSVDPLRDIETIKIELILADIDVIEKRLPKIKKRAETKADKEAVEEFAVLSKLNDALMNSTPIRALSLDEEEQKIIKNFSFLTAKPMLYVCNVSDDELADYSSNEFVKKVKELAVSENSRTCVISAKIEQELSELDDEERDMFLSELGVEESGLVDLIKQSYDMLGLQTFFTAGEKEVRAWTFKKGSKAPECAGIIHSDFEKGFIRAETIFFDDLIMAGSEAKAKELGKFRLEGKDYIAKDGDVFHFRFNL
ncbi:MAG: redox-regulated ATPase YchF [Candidatus Izemoplasmatales bacterium]